MQRRTVLGLAIFFLISFVSDIIIAQNTHSLKTLYESGEIILLKELELSDQSLPPDVYFENPLCVSIHKNGHLFVGDDGANHLKVFTRDGKFLKSIGRKGQGPKEFYGIRLMEVSSNCIAVWEYLNRRISILTLEGEFKTSKKFFRSTGIPVRMRTLPSGEFVIALEVRNPDDNESPQVYSIGIYSCELEHIKTLYKKDLKRIKFIKNPGFAEVFQPFRPSVYWDVSSDGNIIIGYSGNREIEVYHPNNGKLFSFEYQSPMIKVTEEDKKKYFSKMTVARFHNGIKTIEPGAPDYIIRNTQFPAVKDAYQGIIVDSQKNILLQPYSINRDEEDNFFDVFTATGDFIKRVELNGNIHLLYNTNPRIEDGAFWIIERDEDGNAKVLKYKISKGDNS